MKASMLGLVVASTAFGGSSLYLWKQLGEERANAAQVEETTRQLNARIAELEKARVSTVDQRVVNTHGAIAAPFGSNVPAPPDSSIETASAADDTNKVWTVRRTEPTPAMAKAMRSQARAHTRRQYSGVSQELGLGKEKTEKLIDLLTEQQSFGINGLPAFKDQAEMARYFEERQRTNDQAISDLLGPDKALDLRQYQETIPTRLEFDHLARQLADHDAPLTEAQSKKLLEVYLEERKRVPYPDHRTSTNAEEYAKSANSWKDDYEKRIADEANSILDDRQLAAYSEIQQWQKDMRDQMVSAGVAIPPGNVHGAMGVNTMMFSTAPAFISGTIANEGIPAADQKGKKP
jgi:hypothetical protein